MGCKGQMTLFMGLGIVILIVIAIVIALFSYAQEKGFESKKEELQQILLKERKYDVYIQSCLEESAKEAVYMIGRQGGAIYHYQANKTKLLVDPKKHYGVDVLPYIYDDDLPWELSDTIKEFWEVSYAIVQPNLFPDPNSAHPQVPLYPYGNVPLVKNPRIYDMETENIHYIDPFGNFEYDPMVPLCDSYGVNRLVSNSTYTTCHSYDSSLRSDHNSVQEFMAAYVSEKVNSCFNLGSIPELDNFTIREDPSDTIVIIGENDIMFQTNLSIQVESGSKKYKYNFGNFGTRVNVRLKLIHELISKLVKEDTNDIFFDIVKDSGRVYCVDALGRGVPCKREGMKVYKKRDVCDADCNGDCNTCGSVPCKRACQNDKAGIYDDILVIEDNHSILYGKPFNYLVAIENRPPALQLHEKNFGGSFEFDVVLQVNQSFNFTPIAYDPDEDFHNSDGFMEGRGVYIYEEWKEDYMDSFKTGDCDLDPTDCQAHPYNYTYRRPFGTPRNLSHSEVYQSTYRLANFNTTDFDVGAHTTVIKVRDTPSYSGSYDFQVIRILVNHGPFSYCYTYDDIPPYVTSFEDIFNCVVQILGRPASDYYYNWTFTKRDEARYNWDVITNETNISLPNSTSVANPINISNILDYRVELSRKTTYPDLVPKQWYNMTTSLWHWENAGLPSEYLEKLMQTNIVILNATQCLPHRDDALPYPYHNLSGDGPDPFYANHTCCKDDYTFAPSSKECFELNQIGCYNNLTPIDKSIHPSQTYINPVVGVAWDSPHVFKRDFSRDCSGTRGNVCDGNWDESFQLVEQCQPPCSSCVAGRTDCRTDLPTGMVCAPDTKCSIKNNITFDTAPPGNFRCQKGCDQGLCTKTTNCACNTSCGLECDAENPVIFTAPDFCLYNCNLEINWSTSCTFMGDALLPCPSASSGIKSCYQKENLTRPVHPTDPDPYDVFSNFTYGRRCYYNVACQKDPGINVSDVTNAPHIPIDKKGLIFSMGDWCGETGEVFKDTIGFFGPYDDEYLCFDSPGNCNDEGECLSTPDVLREGSTPLKCTNSLTQTEQPAKPKYTHCYHEVSPAVHDCYIGLSCGTSGWSKTPSSGFTDLSSNPVGCGTSCRTQTPFVGNGRCYYGFSCQTDGWHAQERSCTSCPPGANCCDAQYNSACGNSCITSYDGGICDPATCTGAMACNGCSCELAPPPGP